MSLYWLTFASQWSAFARHGDDMIPICLCASVFGTGFVRTHLIFIPSHICLVMQEGLHGYAKIELLQLAWLQRSVLVACKGADPEATLGSRECFQEIGVKGSLRAGLAISHIV